MSAFDLVIHNAQIATASDLYTADIGIIDGRIVSIAAELGARKETIDAAGRFVTPGGVDGHCHLDQPTNDGSRLADDFFTGTCSAACGGTTTVIPFACQIKGHSIREAIDDYHKRAAGKAVIDYAFHVIVSDATRAVTRDEMPRLIAEGYTSFKIYMTYDDLKLNDRDILEVLACTRKHGAITMIHAENSDCISWLTEQLLEVGLDAPRYHGAARPMVVEREATHRAIALSELTDVPILIVHVSGREAIEQIHGAQGRGLRIFAETCPQYLFLSADDLALDDFHGAKCICSPPPRDKANQEAVWTGLANGLFTIVSSDHAPFNFDGHDGKKLNGNDASFDKVPNGIPGIETRLPLLFSEGVLGNRIDIQRFVALTATNPAKLYGLYPRKGTIVVGSDADIVIWDTSTRHTIRNSMLHHAADYTPYEGQEVRAWPALTLSRGRTVWRNGQFVGNKGDGQFLQCGKPALTESAGSGLHWP